VQLGIFRHSAFCRLCRARHKRHTCATHLVASGANLAYVQRLLGHASLRTTQIYARTTIPEIKATLAQTHPRNQADVK